MLEARLRIQQGEEEEGGEEEEEEAGGRKGRLWGASKRSYYGADLADLEVGYNFGAQGLKPHTPSSRCMLY
jgi:hypothetical protein